MTRLPRALHPAAWWLWAIALAAAAARTTNPVLLGLLLVVTGYVVAARRPATPWDRAYVVFLRIAIVAVVLRVALFALLGTGPGTHLLFRLPELPLPHWMAGVRIGGPVSLDGVLYALYDGLRLGVVLVCVGAANALTSPRRLLRSLPSAWYEAGVALTVALSVAPQAVVAVGRLRSARRLRGRTDRGPAAIRGLAVPVLEGALDRAVDLAAAMDARGFGRRGDEPAAARRTTTVLTLTGFGLVVAATYGLVVSSAPSLLGLPLLLAGSLSVAAGLAVGHRRGGRTRYRPERWRTAETAVVVAGLTAAVGVFLAPHDVVAPATSPPALPPVRLLDVLLLLVAALPAWLAPPVPRSTTPRTHVVTVAATAKVAA